MEKGNVKEIARSIIDRLPDNCTWDDLMYEIYVRQAIEKGIADSNADKITAVEDVRKKFGLPAGTIVEKL